MAQVDIKNFQRIFGQRLQEGLYCSLRFGAALRKRSETHRTGVVCQILQFGGKRNIVPGHPLANHISRHAFVVKGHLHGAGRVIDARHAEVQLLLVERFERFFAERIIADSADGHRIVTELGNMVGEIGRRSSELLTFGQHVPQDFSQTNDIRFHSLKV